MYQKICGMPKLPDNSGCRLTYRKSADKGARRGWPASFSSLCLCTVRTSEYAVQYLAIWELHQVTKLIHTLPREWGEGENQGSRKFPSLQESEEILTFLYTNMLGDSSATPLLVCP